MKFASVHIPVWTACLSLAILAGAPGDAGAQQKQKQKQRVGLEQAWHQCIQEAIESVGGKDNPDARDEALMSQRTAVFKGCMTKLGHRGGR